jgi:hypothetical protein
MIRTATATMPMESDFDTALSEKLTFPRFYRHLHKGENGEIGGDHASKHSTSVYRGI